MKKVLLALTLCCTLSSHNFAADQEKSDDAVRKGSKMSPAAIGNDQSPLVMDPTGCEEASQAPHKSLRTTAEQLEQSGRFLAAAQEMDKHLKANKPWSIPDLCYALKLNRQLPHEDRRLRAVKLADQLSKSLKVTADTLTVDLTESSWLHLRPYLDHLIQQTAADPAYEHRSFAFTVLGENFSDFCDWQTALISQSRYPISISGRNLGHLSDKKVNGFRDCRMGISISNYTKKERDSRQSDAYRFFEGDLDEERINSNTFHNLMVRARLSPEELDKGKYNSSEQKPIYVKPFLLQKKTLPECAQEIEDVVLSTLEKSTKPFVVFAISLEEIAPFTVQDIYSCQGRESFFFQIPTRATIVESQERRLYLCYDNFQRSSLDLHGLSLEEAQAKVVSFIREKYGNFETHCQIITGKGNHANPQGGSGILKAKLKEWVKSPGLKPLVRACYMGNGGGIFVVSLEKPKILSLSIASMDDDIAEVIKHILEEDRAGNNCLQIEASTNQPPGYVDAIMTRAIVKLLQTGTFSKTITLGDKRFTWN